MASSLPSFIGLSGPYQKRKLCKYPQVKAHGFNDEGMSMNNVDAHLSVLRKRIEEVRVKERLGRCCRDEVIGWNYQSGYDEKKAKREAKLSESLEYLALVGRAFGLVFVTGSLCLFLVSFLVHLSQK